MKSVACFSAAAAFAVFYFYNGFYVQRPYPPGLAPAILLFLIGLLFRSIEKKREIRRVADESAAAYAAALKAEYEKQQAEAALIKAESEKRQAEAAAQRVQEEADRKARQAEWERTHGRFECKVAGVTFKNSDGVSRQKILKGIYQHEYDSELESCMTSGRIDLRPYQYEGELAYRVVYEGDCVGNIPRSRVSELDAIASRITAGYLTISKFDRDDDFDDDEDDSSVINSDATVYYAVLEVVYTKEEGK